MHRTRSLLVSAIAVVALLAGCGGDDESTSSSGTTEATSTTAADDPSTSDDEPATESATETESEATETETESTETEPATETETETTETEPATETETEATETEPATEDEGEQDPFCAANEKMDTLFDGLDGSTLEGVREGAAQIVEAADELDDEAPEEIADDVDSLIEGLRQFKEIADGADTLEAAQAESRAVSEDLGLDAAGERIQEWVESNC